MIVNSFCNIFAETNKNNMILKVLVMTLAFVGIAILLLCINIVLKKNGRFPNTHVSGNKYLREKKIYCVQTQDRQERNREKLVIEK